MLTPEKIDDVERRMYHVPGVGSLNAILSLAPGAVEWKSNSDSVGGWSSRNYNDASPLPSFKSTTSRSVLAGTSTLKY